MELITITDQHGASPSPEPLVDGLFPGVEPESRPRLFPDKTVYFLSARVHPGESPAQVNLNTSRCLSKSKTLAHHHKLMPLQIQDPSPSSQVDASPIPHPEHHKPAPIDWCMLTDFANKSLFPLLVDVGWIYGLYRQQG